jgi:signal transduction histidine kinase
LSPTITDIGDDGVAQVVSAQGEVLAASTGLGNSGPISSVAPPIGDFEQLTLHGVTDDKDTEDYRLWATTAPTLNGPARIYVGDSLESVSEAAGTVRRSLYVGIPLLMILLAATTWFLVGRALRPVEDIRAEVARITERRLDRRVPVPGSGDEIAKLATTMNTMLDHLEESVTRQREFVADASHELQSPLAALRAQLEVSIAHPDGVDWDALARDLLVDSDRMERLVRDLLFLAKGDAGANGRTDELVDLDVVVLEEAARLRTRSTAAIDVTGVSAAPVEGNPDDLRRLVRNLLDNAVGHAGDAVSVELRLVNDLAVLAISDDGPGIRPEDRERVFERFVRLDGSRVRTRSGTGLGLSIALTVARQHKGDVTVEDRASGASGARFVVRLPASTAAAAAR